MDGFFRAFILRTIARIYPAIKCLYQHLGSCYTARMSRSNPTNTRNFWASLAINAINASPEMRRELRPAMAALRGKEPTLEEVCSVAADVLDTDARRIRMDSLSFLAEYVRSRFKDARKAAMWLTARDRRLGVWAALACSYWALDVASEQSNGSKAESAIRAGRNCAKITTAWVQGLASADDVRRVADDCPDYSPYASDAANSASYAAYAATETPEIDYIGYAVSAVPDASQSASSSVKVRKEVLLDLVSVIADAILDFPPAVRSNPTRRRSRR